jgi:RNA polymerase sigma-70 factor, ECF subfamily
LTKRSKERAGPAVPPGPALEWRAFFSDAEPFADFRHHQRGNMASHARSKVSEEAAEESATGAPAIVDTTPLVNALRGGDPKAPAELFDRYGMSVHRVLVRIIGSDDPESSDLLHDTFLRALQNVRRLKKPQALKSWLHSIAVFTAREWLRARRRMGHPQPPTAVPDRPAASASPETREAVRALYQILDTFPEDERIAFVLRLIEGMELTEVAEACRVSLSTTRRRIKRAQLRFQKALPSFPAIGERLDARRTRPTGQAEPAEAPEPARPAGSAEQR